MGQAVIPPRALLRVSVQSEGRRLDVGVPAQLPLIELMPGFARSLGVLDPTMTHVGYALQRADGTVLDPGRGAAEQGLQEGELLTLSRGGQLAEPRVYDDIVEAVLDATADQHRPWTPQDNARTALAASLGLLALCALLLLAAGPGLLHAVIAIGGMTVLLTVSAVLARLGQPEAGHSLGLAAALFGGVGGYLAVPAGLPVWGWPLAAAGLGALVVGGLALALTPVRPELQLIPVSVGAVVGVTALIGSLLPEYQYAVYALMTALAATLGNGLPWLALSSTRIRVISPQTSTEIFAPPPGVDPEDVKQRTASGHRSLTSLRIALGLVMLVATPLVAAGSAAGATLCALAFAGLMFPARQSYARSNVLVLMALGAVGIGLAGVVVTLAQPSLRGTLLVALSAITAVVITITLLNPKARMRLGRLADAAEVCVLAVLLPLGVVAAGWA